MRRPEPNRGEIRLVDLSPTRGHEQAGIRPGLIVSTDPFNHGPAELVIVLPLNTRDRRIPLHIALDPPQGGVRARSFIKCEHVRSVAKERLSQRWGAVPNSTMDLVEDRLRILLQL